MDELFNNIISNRISNILDTIHKAYPDKFIKSNIKKEHAFLMEHIKMLKTEHNITNAKPIKQKSEKIKAITENKRYDRSAIPETNKCSARVWHDNIISVKSGRKVSKIDDEFKVSDFRKLNIDEFLKKYKIGNQCKNKRFKESKYCALHNEHLIHGDINVKPTKELCFHFIKGAKFS